MMTSMDQRAIDCIYLRPFSISKNIHEFYNLVTKQIITRQYCTTIPTTAHIINIIEKQAQDNNMPLGITFKSRDVTQPHLWLAGADEEKESEVDEEKHDEQNLDNLMEESMDINDIHKIMQTPSKFHVPDYNYKAQI